MYRLFVLLFSLPYFLRIIPHSTPPNLSHNIFHQSFSYQQQLVSPTSYANTHLPLFLLATPHGPSITANSRTRSPAQSSVHRLQLAEIGRVDQPYRTMALPTQLDDPGDRG